MPTNTPKPVQRALKSPQKATKGVFPNPDGQPIKLDNRALRAKFIKAYVISGGIVEACQAVGIHRDTYRKHIQRDPDLKIEMDKALQERLQRVKDDLYKLTTEPDLTPKEKLEIHKEYLNRIDPAIKRLQAKQDKQFNVNITGVILTDEQATRISQIKGEIPDATN